MNNDSEKTFAVVGEFDNPAHLIETAKKVCQAGYKKFDTHSPYPIHGMDEAMGLSDSKLGWIVMFFALIGGIGGFLFMAWTSSVAYPLNISAKPLISVEAFMPIVIQLVILFSALSTVIGMFVLNSLPMHYHPIFKHPEFHKASSDGFFISIEADDPQFEESKTPLFLSELGGKNVSLVKD